MRHHHLALLLCLMTACASAVDVTSIDTSGTKPVFMVQGKPFFYHGVQISPIRLEEEHGWTWPQMAPLFARAAADGFTVMPVPIPWDRLEGRKGSWDWSRLDTAIDHAAKYGISIEVLWFGSVLCGSYHRLPGYVQSRQKVVDSAGRVVTDSNRHSHYDLTDPNLLNDEKTALATTMNHVASYLASKGYPVRTVVGVQVMNEPTVIAFEDGTKPTDRSYSAFANAKWSSESWTSAAAFNADVMHKYLLGLADAVKTSNHRVWTRVNFQDNWEGNLAFQVVTNNEKRRTSLGTTPLDFIGEDPYTSSLSSIYGYCTNSSKYNQGKNLVLVMENSGKYSNTDKLMFNALAGDGHYAVWELNQTMATWDTGIYSTDNAAKTIVARPHTQSIRDFNAMLGKARRDLASKQAGGPSLAFFNREFVASSTSSAVVGGRTIGYGTTNTGGGIAIARADGSWVFLTTTASTFTLPADLPIGSLQHGYFNADDVWVGQGPVTASGTSFTPAAYQCVRLVPGGAAAGQIQFSSATYSKPEGASGTSTATITATRTGGSAGAIGVSYATSDGTATAGSDYTAASGILSWPDGDTAGKTFTVTVIGDATYEADETANLTLSAPTGGATLGALKTVVLTIANDDVGPAGSLQWSASSASATEGAGNRTLTVTRNSGTAGVVTVRWTTSTSSSTATVGSDYSSASGTVSWADGDAAPKTIAVPILADTLVEPSEVFRVVLSSPTGNAVLGTTTTAYITILDDDAMPLPAPWTARDLGSVLATGSASLGAGDLITLAGSGTDIWNQADGCHFASQPITGDFDLVARVDSQSNTNAWAKAGLMVRESTAAGSRHASCLVTPANGSNLCWRATTGGSSASIAGPKVTAPTWLKLSRRGASFSGYQSADGAAWTLVGSQTLSLSSSLLAGLAVSSHANGLISVAQFSQVALAPMASN